VNDALRVQESWKETAAEKNGKRKSNRDAKTYLGLRSIGSAKRHGDCGTIPNFVFAGIRKNPIPRKSADAYFFDDAYDVRGGNVIQRMFVFLFEALAQIFGGDVAGLAVAEVAARPRITPLPSTKNLQSMVSLWRVAVPFQQCEKRHR
jgi:hypothetical protein